MGMVRTLTPNQMIRNGYMSIVTGAIILLINLYSPIFFAFELLLHFLLILLGGINICIGIMRIVQGKARIREGIGPNDPVPPRGTFATQQTSIPLKTCPSCGAEIAAEARFCPQCRAQLSDLRIN